MNPALILGLIQTIATLGATIANKPKAAADINTAMTMVSSLQLNISQIGQALSASRQQDGTIDEAGWNAVHAFLDSERTRLEKLLGV